MLPFRLPSRMLSYTVFQFLNFLGLLFWTVYQELGNVGSLHVYLSTHSCYTHYKFAEFLERDDAWLPKDLLRRVGFRYSLTEKPNGDCVFLQSSRGKRGCAIYSVRPLQCRTWPFWSSNIDTPEDWMSAPEEVFGNDNTISSLADEPPIAMGDRASSAYYSVIDGFR